MSDLTATNCGCNDSCGCASAQNNNGCDNWIWIILLLYFCGGNSGRNGGCGCNDSGSGLFGGNSGCEWIIWILLLSCFCGNGSLFGGNGCGC
ncbi:MAG: hypothetical protein NC432_15075 [Roseburia sp.]|nr:hypothetical protein [Roseburia sp.]MCM1097235.1 hypothetical protein [Ruminococcus flavefaciens]